METIKILIYLLFMFQIINTIENKTFLFRCGADDDTRIPKPATNSIPIEKDRRKLDNSDFKDFHIYLDLINIKNDIRKYHLEENEELFISSLQKAVETLESLLKVRVPKRITTFTDEEILNINITDWNKSMIGSHSMDNPLNLGIDLFIFGRFDENMEKSTLASAGARYTDSETKQPLVGVVNINTKVNYSKINSKEYFESIIIHEFTHILGFSNYFFTQIFDITFSREDEKGIMRYFINSPKVLEVAKNYYNCPNIDGVELEESGGSGTAGSHWEARILLGEYMNGVVYPEEQVISEFTLALLEDLGYYKANYYTGGLMRYGKGKGCDFIKKRCVNSSYEINPLFENEFYDSISSPGLMDSSCSSGRQSRTYYAWWVYDNLPEHYKYFSNERYGGFAPADYCPVAKEYSKENQDAYYIGHCSLKGSGKYGTNIKYKTDEFIRINSTHGYFKEYNFSNEEIESITGETYSDHSYCYQSSLIKTNNESFYILSNEIRAICYESFCSDYSLTIKIKDDYIVCPRAGGKIEVDGYSGYFLCPDYNLICSGTVICNDMFDCVKKKSGIKSQSYNYDYIIKTSQNIENSKIIGSDNETNYELAENGICPINCKYCQENKKCLNCRNDYGLLGSKGKEEIICKPESKLNIGYYKDDNIYYKCMDNCDICFNGTFCENCSLGFIYINNKCITPIEHCKIYGIDDKCEICENNFAFKETDRTACFDKNIFDNYYTKDDGISYYPCNNQISKCSKCNYDKNDIKIKCDLCLADYVLFKEEELCLSKRDLNKSFFYLNETHINKCSNSIEKCDQCENNNTCIKCQDNYFLINDDKQNCIDISKISINNYFLDNDKTTYYSCNNTLYHDVKYCEKCSSKDICSLCQENFTFINGNKSLCIEKEKLKDKYIQDPQDVTNFIKCENHFGNCDSCNDKKCLSCKEGFIFMNDNHTNCVLNSTSNNIDPTKIDNKKLMEIFILQVQIKNKRLKAYVTFSVKITKDFHIKLSIDYYKSNDQRRNLQQAPIKDYQVDLYINQDSIFESSNIMELQSEEQFSDSDRAVINQDKDYEFEMRILDNNNKILDTLENKNMINKGEIVDFSNIPSTYSVNQYYIKSSSKGCEFELTSNNNINEQSQNIALNFLEKNNNNVIIDAQCILSKDNKNKIPCKLKQEINNNYILDSYVGSNKNGIFYVLQDNNKDNFQLICEKKKNGLETKWIIIICAGSAAFLAIIITIIVCCCKKKKQVEIGKNEKPKNFMTVPQTTENIYSTDRDDKKRNKKTKKNKKNKTKKKGKKGKNVKKNKN